jgi:Xaa-Pro aminopeptidase
MSTVARKLLDPKSSGEIHLADPKRLVDIETKQKAVAEFLDAHRLDALLLQDPRNFAWFTSGADNSRGGSSESIAALLITADARVIMTGNADTAQLFDREVAGLGFQLKERPWHEPRAALIADVCRGRSVASDFNCGHTNDVSSQLVGLRIPFTEVECERLREVGLVVAHAIEATARHVVRGQTEAEIAGEAAHRLIKQRVLPERVQVCVDGRQWRYPHWSFGSAQLDQYCSISVVGRRYGLCAAASRTVSFGPPPNELRGAYHRSMLLQATGMYFSQPNWELFEIWNRVQRIYEKYGYPDEWQNADQAEVMGYFTTEVPVVPNSEFRAAAAMAIHWHPAIGLATCGDTILVGEEECELVTPMESWPKLNIAVKGKRIFRPDILRRD